MQREIKNNTIQYIDRTKRDSILLSDIPSWAWWHFDHVPYQRGKENIEQHG